MVVLCGKILCKWGNLPLPCCQMVSTPSQSGHCFLLHCSGPGQQRNGWANDAAGRVEGAMVYRQGNQPVICFGWVWNTKRKTWRCERFAKVKKIIYDSRRMAVCWWKNLDQPDVLRFKPSNCGPFFRAQMLHFPMASALGFLVFLAFQLLELVTVGVFLTFCK